MTQALDFFREVTVRISSHLEVDKALRNLFVYLRQYVPCDHMGMCYIDEMRGEVRSLASVEERKGDVATGRQETLFRLSPEAVHALQRAERGFKFPGVTIFRRADIMRHGLPHPDLYVLFEDLARTNNLMVGLSIGKHRLGMLVIGVEPPEKYTRKHVALLESVMEPLAIAFSNARRYEELLQLKERLAEDNRELSRELENLSGNTVIGADGGLKDVMGMVRLVAPLSSPVLLLGETGTGKEVLAHTIHENSPRRNQPFVRVQCGAIPETLLDSELFGHEKGAFTGALATTRGRFERAHGGTLFLDEIGELSSDAQVKLLRVLQEKEFERVGGSETIKVDVRVIAATHRDLNRMVGEGHFREDLWFRLNVFPLTIPPLRERRQDIPALLVHFLNHKSRDLGLPTPSLPGPEIVERLCAYQWPGNVRELQNVVERSLITNSMAPLLLFPQRTAPIAPATDGKTRGDSATDVTFQTLDSLNAEHIRQVMRHTGGRIQGPDGAAAILGLKPNTLRARMQKLDISYGRQATRWEG